MYHGYSTSFCSLTECNWCTCLSLWHWQYVYSAASTDHCSVLLYGSFSCVCSSNGHLSVLQGNSLLINLLTSSVPPSPCLSTLCQPLAHHNAASLHYHLFHSLSARTLKICQTLGLSRVLAFCFLIPND